MTPQNERLTRIVMEMRHVPRERQYIAQADTFQLMQKLATVAHK